MINTFRSFQQKIEVEFWEFIIPRMKEKPAMVEKAAKIIFTVQDKLPTKNVFFQAIFWTLMGLSIGLGIGVLLA